MKNRNVVFSCIGLLVALLIVAAVAVRAKDASPEDAVARTFEALQVSDAEKLQDGHWDPSAEEKLWHYTSQAEGLSYYFAPSDGSLVRVYNENADFQSETSALSALTEEEHLAWALEYAQNCIAADLIGELVVESQGNHVYVFSEVYDGIPTGTLVAVNCLENGELFSLMPKFGAVFEKRAFGGYQLRNGDDFIGEDAACTVAREAVAEDLEENGDSFAEERPTVTMKAREAQLYYEVRLNAVNAQALEQTYILRVDAYDGTILEMAYGK